MPYHLYLSLYQNDNETTDFPIDPSVDFTT